mmetsp:Transcript_19202/g.61091  ORF Transcript_19202/g.61091 Transcript_19202/m.61091 type:complete len:230 (+) Transcript_19202:74-763(+)
MRSCPRSGATYRCQSQLPRQRGRPKPAHPSELRQQSPRWRRRRLRWILPRSLTSALWMRARLKSRRTTRMILLWRQSSIRWASAGTPRKGSSVHPRPHTSLFLMNRSMIVGRICPRRALTVTGGWLLSVRDGTPPRRPRWPLSAKAIAMELCATCVVSRRCRQSCLGLQVGRHRRLPQRQRQRLLRNTGSARSAGWSLSCVQSQGRKWWPPREPHQLQLQLQLQHLPRS